jgi:hypothetical protein
MYPAYLIGSRAVALMGIRTHLRARRRRCAPRAPDSLGTRSDLAAAGLLDEFGRRELREIILAHVLVWDDGLAVVL